MTRPRTNGAEAALLFNIGSSCIIMASSLKAAAGSFERSLLPRLNGIDGELKTISARMDGLEKSINTRIDGVEKSITELDKRITTNFGSVRNELHSELKVIETKLDQMDSKLDIDRRMTVMEARMKELEKQS
jgi:hypothetical protein